MIRNIDILKSQCFGIPLFPIILQCTNFVFICNWGLQLVKATILVSAHQRHTVNFMILVIHFDDFCLMIKWDVFSVHNNNLTCWAFM